MLNGDRLPRPTTHAQTGIDLVHVTQSDTDSPLFVQMERIAASLSTAPFIFIYTLNATHLTFLQWYAVMV